MSGTPVFSFARRWASRAPARTPLPLGATFLAALLAVAPARANDDIPPQFMTQYEAARDYLHLIQAAEAANAPTQLDSADAMQLLAAITHRDAILGPDYVPADLGLLVNACEYGKTVSTRLMQFGLAAMPVACYLTCCAAAHGFSRCWTNGLRLPRPTNGPRWDLTGPIPCAATRNASTWICWRQCARSLPIAR